MHIAGKAAWLLVLLSSVVGARVVHRTDEPFGLDAVKDLKMAIVVYRHGDRTAMGTYSTDPHSVSIWPEGLGQLTSRGVEQHYSLGQFLRKRFALLLKDVSLSQIYVQSSGLARTLRSAAANSAGFFPPAVDRSGRWRSNDSLSDIWQPIPIFSRIGWRDALFRIGPCPLFDILDKFPQSLVDELGWTEQQHFFHNVTGIPAADFPMAFFRFNDILFCQSQHGFPMPTWATPEVLLDLQRLAAASLRLSIGGRRSDPQQRLRRRIHGGPMLKQIMETLALRANGTTGSGDVRIQVYSAHEVNIAALLATLELYDFENDNHGLVGSPNYAACLIFELFQNNTVRISLKNNKPEESRDAQAIVMKHPQCATFCPIDQLLSLTGKYFMTDDEWLSTCNKPPLN
ncbi:putative Lysosomal acid phosphatase [Hypsibius exemplaris]|uniref:acid phosphatase n=1 Tax=Hypsibius exemplaris TaxID=2072580 RepID=A0A9X6NFS7_HYPEX|nr:putative Lysosomal acid phosphatase [Hypsibius exemplaris]